MMAPFGIKDWAGRISTRRRRSKVLKQRDRLVAVSWLAV